jgi:hypothetical protein
MEASGVPDRVQVSSSTWALTRDSFDYEARDVDVKGLGPMTAYLLMPDQARPR